MNHVRAVHSWKVMNLARGEGKKAEKKGGIEERREKKKIETLTELWVLGNNLRRVETARTIRSVQSTMPW